MSSLDELFQALQGIESRLEEAGAHLGTCQGKLDEARQALVRLDPEHPETVLPPGLPRTHDQVERAQRLVDLVRSTLRDFGTRL
ncbi:hypothetical protein EIL87_15090 [Saccharopolyspora rhizosphaerae]|uniref:Uncharacterized protein n=1 Tax=Saccharopolyspora rhizosphaerae TaxID=2492662 RepID=A0A3R8PZS4_9PSEU|nr:hypothetical protein [Saccharopolyspora rhizosphaerae]RRO15390.1 hypothetical protein EIL87_15090 [Saccharopolyspora rhizosphaerae]